MAKVVFCYSRWSAELKLFGHFSRRNSTWQPLAQLLLAACVEKAGHEAIMLDGEANAWTTERLAQEAVKLKADAIGINAYSPFFHLSADLAQAIKRINPDQIVCGGGPHFTIAQQDAMVDGFDYGFLGEAEESFPEFVTALEHDRDVRKIQGLMYRDKGEIKSTGARWLTLEAMTKADLTGSDYPLDRLPLPARHLVNMRYYKLGTPRGRNYFTSIQGSRGCRWGCIFCASDAIKTKRVIFKSPKRIVEEMKDIATRWPFVQHLYFVDDVLLFYPQHILEVADRIEAEGLKFTFESSTRANTVTEPIIKRLAEVGLIRLSFGLETIDPKMRETMEKRVPIDDYPRANRICTDYGVEAMNSLMIGLPGETEQTVRDTINWVAGQRDIAQANVSVATPYIGTKFYDMASTGEKGLQLLSHDFREYLRYGHAVVNVGDLKAKDLIELQNWAFVKIYMKWWRLMPVFRKHGIFGLLLQLWRLFKMWRGMILKSLVVHHPKEQM